MNDAFGPDSPADAAAQPVFDQAFFADTFSDFDAGERAEVLRDALALFASLDTAQRTARATGDGAALLRAMHKLGGSAGMIGCYRLGALARGLEVRIRALTPGWPPADGFAAEFAALEACLADTVAELNEHGR